MTYTVKHARMCMSLFRACLVLLLPATAHADGHLKSSRPAAGTQLSQVPRSLRLDFSEAPDLTFTMVRLLSAAGRDVPLGGWRMQPTRTGASRWLLLAKLAILGIVTITGFYNWRFVKPRLGSAEATLHLRRSARVEVAVAILVLLVTSVLVASPTAMDMIM